MRRFKPTLNYVNSIKSAGERSGVWHGCRTAAVSFSGEKLLDGGHLMCGDVVEKRAAVFPSKFRPFIYCFCLGSLLDL